MPAPLEVCEKPRFSAFSGVGLIRVGRCLRVRDHGGVRRDLVPAQRGGEAVTAEYTIGLVLVVGLVAYLLAALLFPERF